MSAHRRNVLALYRQLLRLQRRLPDAMGRLGAGYIREEFRKHKGVGSDHAHSFILEWEVQYRIPIKINLL